MSIYDDIYDLVCVGFGPANLALTAALFEAKSPRPVRIRAFEGKETFSWHADLQLPGSDCQVSYLKDLATLRDPTSTFTFLNYLAHAGRLQEFAELGAPVPSRHDFSAYFLWVANHLSHLVSYSSPVVSVEPEHTPVGVEAFRVVHEKGGKTASVRAKNVSVAVGAQPAVPRFAQPSLGSRCFHTDRFKGALGALALSPSSKVRITIVGTGQSAVDVATYLLTHYTSAKVTVISRGFAFRAADDNPFLNDFFTSETAAAIHTLDPDQRIALAHAYYETGVGVADGRLVRKLFEVVYRLRSQGGDRFRIANFRELASVDAHSDFVRFTTKSVLDGAVQTIETDVLILATGYSRSLRVPFLEPVESFIFPGDAAYPSLDADYSLSSLRDHPASLFLQGYAAYSHGVGDEALSIVATRAALIQSAIEARLGSARRTAGEC